MRTIGILTCEILELEFAYLLNNDEDISRVTVLENNRSAGIIKALESNGSGNTNQISALESFAPDPANPMEALVQVLELGLHSHKKKLQEGLVKAACKMASMVDTLMLGYGLCGNALEKPDELFADVDVPLFIPMDEDHPVDDCVGLIIGGRRAYYEEQCKVAGTFFMIPGWTHHWRRMFEREFGNLSVDMARRLFKNYERSLLIPTPIMSEKTMQQNSADFNKIFGFREDIRPGTLDILKDSWNSAKASLQTV
jgi:hypothetical protein